MGGPARLVALLAVAAATAGRGGRRTIRARGSGLRGGQRPPGAARRETAAAARRLARGPLRGDRASVALAAAYHRTRAHAARADVFRARRSGARAARGSKPGASATLRRLYAQVLQHRHEFAAAEALLDAVLRDAPHDDDARLLRASVRLVRGDFPGARADCAQLAAAGGEGAALGFACLAEALAGGGDLERARALLDDLASRSQERIEAPRAPICWRRAPNCASAVTTSPAPSPTTARR